MFRNYLTTALNNLARNRLYAAITILGLAVAFTVAILVGQFVRNEFSYDRWIPGHERIYRIVSVSELGGQKPLVGPSTASLAGRLRAGFPAVTVARLSRNSTPVRRGPGDEAATEPSLEWADPDIFKILALPTLAGDLSTALEQPDTVVITRAMARKYFGRDLPIGATLEVQGGDLRYHPMRVTAVLKDLPANTTFSGDEIFASARSAYSFLAVIDAHPDLGSFNLGLSTLARLAPGASVADLQRALDAAGRPDAEAMGRRGEGKVSFHPAPLDQAHWAPREPGTRPAGDKGVTWAIAAVAGLIVLVAAINFVTLMTARATRRGVEVGVRKTAGARRGDLMVQFMGEALIQVTASAVIAAALAEVLVRPFGVLMQRTLAVDFLHDPLLPSGLAVFALLVGVLASIYPALVLSGFRPAAALRGGNLRGSGSPLARASLVGIQFAVLIGLILTTATIYRQTQFALARGLGAADSERIVNIFTRCNTAFPDEVRRLPGVEAAACATPHALNMAKLVQAVQLGGGRVAQFDVAPVDFGLFELYRIRPLAGRLFSRDHGEDQLTTDPKARAEPNVVINETAARQLGYGAPGDAVGRSMTWTRDLHPGETPLTGRSLIVGVVPDMPVTVRTPVNPTFYILSPRDVGVLSVKMTGRDMPGTLKAIAAAWKRTGPSRPISETFLGQFRRNLYLDLVIQDAATAICAGIAILLACLGLFALSAFMTERRTKEIGIRKAMGAGQWDVVVLLLWQFTVPVLCAVAVVAPVGYIAMNNWLAQFAYRAPLSIWTFALAGASALAIAWLTVGWQSYAAARARPAGALQYE
ncbi:MAG: FtsX-like permease family protein [Caulobacteraceae bacterium]